MGHTDHKSDDYRTMDAFNLTTIVHLSTLSFCKRFIARDDDQLEVAVKMAGGSRSAKQSFLKGSVGAKDSLAGLLGDLEDYLAERNEIPWSVVADDHKAISRIQIESFEATEDLQHDYWTFLAGERAKFDSWIQSENPVVVANALILLVQRSLALLERNPQRRESEPPRRGGFQDRRPQDRRPQTRSYGRDEAAPTCRACGKTMQRRHGKENDFWGCSGFPECKETQNMAGARDSRPRYGGGRPSRGPSRGGPRPPRRDR